MDHAAGRIFQTSSQCTTKQGRLKLHDLELYIAVASE